MKAIHQQKIAEAREDHQTRTQACHGSSRITNPTDGSPTAKASIQRLIFQRISLAVVCNELSKATTFRNDSVLRIVPQVYWLERFTANRVNFGNDVPSLWTLSSAELVSVSILHRQVRIPSISIKIRIVPSAPPH